MRSRRERIRFTDDQLKILIKTFNETPYPDYTARENLALEMGIEESRIQVWFQNRRARYRVQRKSEPKEDLRASQDEGHPVENSQGKDDRRRRTTYTSSQLRALVSAFVSNPYPRVDSREQLAKEIGVPESRVQIWFQNQRSRFRAGRRKKPDEPSEQKQDEESATVLDDSSAQDLPLPTSIPASSPEDP
ncbi:double homeobox protein A [Pteronotus mesoamericanus]|uniref:double homeobox protein A n=1 Tax=Pteronotus mesoamericanus TaxID=1884717 RepID=UPI0023ED6109|nr:double homeobox protein A [Pteronotus parnellii mesoamericanus]